jgi:hypothetical protein
MAIAAEWSSLEVAKLIVGVSVPLGLFALGFFVNRAAGKVEAAQWSHRKLIEHRLVLYERIAPTLNDLYVFFALKGHFRTITPDKALKCKRELDREFHTHEHLFSTRFAERYQAFIDACFKPAEVAGRDARFRSSVSEQKKERGETVEWKPEWDAMFVPRGESTERRIVQAHYSELMEQFAAEVGVRADERARRNPR